MQNYIKLNGKKIELNETQVEEIKRSFGIGAKRLSEIPEEGTFKIGEYEFFVLEHEDGVSRVILKNILTTTKFGENNNYIGSYVDEICNDFANKIAAIIGKENMIEFDLDLTANDGMKCYGTAKRRAAALRTADMQRKYAYTFDKKEFAPGKFEWLATPDSTPKHDIEKLVLCVSPRGDINYNNGGYCDDGGVRPFCILKSDIFVSE